MAVLGTYLRELREGKNASLEEMARATRIGKRQLEAIETETFAELPAPVFVKGFIRAYCGFLGESADEALRRYRSLIGEPDPAVAATPVASPRSTWRAGPLFVSLLLLVVLGTALAGLTLFLRQEAVTHRQSADVVHSQLARPDPQAAPVREDALERAASPPTPPGAQAGTQRPETAGEPAPAQPGPTPGPRDPAPTSGSPAGQAKRPSQRLVVTALETTWIRVAIDDGVVVQDLLQPGTKREWTAERRFALTVGNAGGIEVELNGRRVPPLGGRGVVVRDVILPRAEAPPGS
jgi:cytoskeleton protein RodZ